MTVTELIEFLEDNSISGDWTIQVRDPRDYDTILGHDVECVFGSGTTNGDCYVVLVIDAKGHKWTENS